MDARPTNSKAVPVRISFLESELGADMQAASYALTRQLARVAF